MIVLAGSYLRGWCQSDSIPSLTGTAVKVPIDYIRIANTKILQGKLYKEIIVQQDSVIQLHKLRYQELNKETMIVQEKLYNSYQINRDLNNSLERSKKRNKWIAGGAIVSAVGFIVLLIAK